MARRRPVDVRVLLARPPDFIYSGSNDQMFKTWSLGHTIDYRDADASRRSAGRQKLEAVKKRFIEGTDFKVERFDHWLVGWVDHLTFQVLADEKDQMSVTKIAKFMVKGRV